MIASQNVKKLFLVASLPLFFLGCGPHVTALPDDPDNEPVAEGDADFPSQAPAAEVAPVAAPVEVPIERQPAVLSGYDHLDPQHIVPSAALKAAVLYYDQVKSTLKNPNVLSILDFSQSSTQKRFYIIDMKTGAVWNMHVSHGKGSDANHDGFAEKFSNVSGSNASSLGFYRTAETYSGKHGYSLRLDGLSTTNSNARARAIVIHGATYVQDKAVIQGRSWGCPAVSMTNYKKLIDTVKGGSLIYALNTK